jgi:hypothetical protein
MCLTRLYAFFPTDGARLNLCRSHSSELRNMASYAAGLPFNLSGIGFGVRTFGIANEAL